MSFYRYTAITPVLSLKDSMQILRCLFLFRHYSTFCVSRALGGVIYANKFAVFFFSHKCGGQIVIKPIHLKWFLRIQSLKRERIRSSWNVERPEWKGRSLFKWSRKQKSVVMPGPPSVPFQENLTAMWDWLVMAGIEGDTPNNDVKSRKDTTCCW